MNTNAATFILDGNRLKIDQNAKTLKILVI